MNTQDIIRELIAIDPSLAEHERDLPALIEQFVAAKPDTRFDEAFARRLRAELLQSKQQARPLWTLKLGYGVLGAVAALAIGIPSVYFTLRGTPRVPGAVELPSQAFGTLTAPQPPTVSEAGTAGYALGSDAAMSAKLVAAPGGPSAAQIFTYAAPEWEMPEAEQVYRRARYNPAAVRAAVRVPDIAGISLPSFSGLAVRSMELVQDVRDGYAIQMSAEEGTISIYQNWAQWEQPTQPLAADAVLPEGRILSIARDFVTAHGITVKAYGAPVIDAYWKQMLEQAGTPSGYPMPEETSVIYPYVIDGRPVVDESGNPMGMLIMVNHRYQKVTSAYGIMLTGMESSAYDFSEKSLVDAAISRGGVNTWIPEGAASSIRLSLDAPERVYLVQYVPDAAGGGQQLFVPALRFPVQSGPAGSPRFVTVPLIKSLLTAPAVDRPSIEPFMQR